MKHLFYIVLCLLFVSCGDFMEYKDKDKVIPENLDYYKEFIMGELLLKSMGTTGFNLWYMSDDVGSYMPSSLSSTSKDEREYYQSFYLWAKEPQITVRGDEKIDPAWENFYHKIVVCNVIESDLNEFADDPAKMKYRLLGEVQAIRAISYWYLVNMYGEPWRSAEQAKTAMGVPINRERSIMDKLYTRSSLAEVYQLMEEDLKNALANLGKGEQVHTMFRPGKDIVRLFLSRIYLEQKRWDDVITVCDEALKESSRKIISKAEMETYADEKKPMLNKNNNSILFSWMQRDANSFSSGSYGNAVYTMSDELKSLYAPEDARIANYVITNSWYKSKIMKYDAQFSGCYTMNYRVEEFYLNRAEAYIESGAWDKGMKDLNAIYSERVSGGELQADGVETARKEMRNEKRREFCFEDMRWFDIRRWGVAVEHEFQSFGVTGMTTTYVLDTESPNYVMSLPLDIQRRNFDIEQPKRVESKTK